MIANEYGTFTERKRWAAGWLSGSAYDRIAKIEGQGRCAECSYMAWAEHTRTPRAHCARHDFATRPRATCGSFKPREEPPRSSPEELLRVLDRVASDPRALPQEQDDAKHQAAAIRASLRNHP